MEETTQITIRRTTKGGTHETTHSLETGRSNADQLSGRLIGAVIIEHFGGWFDDVKSVLDVFEAIGDCAAGYESRIEKSQPERLASIKETRSIDAEVEKLRHDKIGAVYKKFRAAENKKRK